MHLPPEFIDELKNRINPSDVVGKHVKLTHKAGGEYLGCCPFHKEKTPSFTVSNPKGFYHCFGCGVHGNMINFVMEVEGKTFIDAVTSLAEMAGISMPKASKHEAEQYNKRTSLYDLMEKTCGWFERQLHHSNNPAMPYLKSRGITSEAQTTFRLGYSPDGFERLKQAMVAEGFSEQQLLDTGLIIQSEKQSKKTYDRFRNRLMFPICDGKGKVIAFGGRILGDGQPKYLNSPETELFHKGNVLYNLHIAQEKAFRKKTLVAVEGYMDVIALYQAGIQNTVAPLGTAITDSHIQAMWRMAPEPVICLDGDNAGKRAMERTAKNHLHLLKPGHSLSFCTLPEGKDPDDYINENGVDAMRQLLLSPAPLSKVLWETTLTETPAQTPEQRAQLEANLMELADTIEDKTVQYNYRDFFKSQLWGLKRQQNRSNNGANATGNFNNNFANNNFRGNKAKALPPAGSGVNRLMASVNSQEGNKLHHIEATLLLTALNHPQVIQTTDIFEHFEHITFSQDSYTALHEELCEIFQDHDDNTIEREALHSQLAKGQFSALVKTLLNARFHDPFTEITADASIVIRGWQYSLGQYHLHHLNLEYNSLLEQINTIGEDLIWELKKQKDVAEINVEKYKNDYLMALDD